MATDSPKVRPKTYWVNHGFSHSSLHSRQFRHELHRHGYVPARTIADADIIIAHSAGTWNIPSDVRAHLILFVGMPLRAGDGSNLATFWRVSARTWRAHGRQKPGLVLRNGLLSTFTIITQPRRHVRIIRRAAVYAPPPKGIAGQVVFIVNRHDLWPRSSHLDEIVSTLPFSFISLPGTHDDIWYSPRTYIAIINHYA
jgi:hypothetical protein